MTDASNPELDGIAIIGLAGRFPGARNPQEFWQNLKNGVESISHFSVEELEIRDRFAQASEPNYVRARSILEDIDKFDAELFGIYPREAELIDPQHRVFLECCWEAIEDAGYDVARIAASLGVFAGCSPNSYFLTHVCDGAQYASDFAEAYQVGHYTEMVGAIPDTLTTRVAYKLNLRGPAMTLVCACSTSLVAVSQACNNLLTYQCDAALAGGVSITLPQKRGYLCQPGGMVSLDGHCRAFDENAQGTVFGSGAGVVLLKRLEEAVADGDHIYGVIKGSAVNNDGAGKIGFTAPAIEGQASVIATAQAQAGIDPRTITYIEAHGTGTPLGDPIEVAALTQVFRASTPDIGYCAIGTAKTNVGHLDVAAGVTGLIKTALSMKHRQLPPTLHFRRPNPKLELEKSPFYVSTELMEWKPAAGAPLRAGVSAFGVGGTNAHVVLEEAPSVESSVSVRPHQLLLLSARSEDSLNRACILLAEHLEKDHETNFADVAYTLATGRKTFPYRRTIAGRDAAEAASLLRSGNSAKSAREPFAADGAPVYFLFPGQGSQSVNMGREIYETEKVFRESIDRCALLLKPHLGQDIRTVMYGGEESQLDQTQFAQPAIFITEYSLAQLWLSWGIQPAGMLGHSVGEFVAGCLAGVFSLEDALGLIAARANLMQSVDRGEMLVVRLPEQETIPLLHDSLCLAAINSPSLSVVSGPPDSIQSLTEVLDGKRIAFRRLRTSHAFHSSMMDGILDTFTERVKTVTMRPPRLRYLSCTTGVWISDQEATDPQYWAHHLRQTVRFSPAIEKLRAIPNAILLEVGSGNTLQTLARQHAAPQGIEQTILSSLVNPLPTGKSETESILNNLGKLWIKGVTPDWTLFYAHEKRRRVSLPTYSFDRKRHWIEKVKIEHIAERTDTRSADTSSADTNQAAKDQTEAIVQQETNMNLTLEPTIGESSRSSRRDRLRTVLTGILQQLSGMGEESLDAGTTFLELGFDSLFLTQVAAAVQKKLGFTVTFRQLLDRQDCIEALAEYLDEKLPASVLAEEPAKPVPTPAVTAAIPAGLPTIASLQAQTTMSSAPAAGVEQIFKDQLQAMSQLITRQLEFLAGDGIVQQPVARQPMSVEVTKPVGEPKSAKEFKPFGPYKPVQRGHADELTDQQRTYLNGLISRYTKKTRQSKEWTQKYRRVLADPRVVSGFTVQWKELVYPIVTNRSRGSRLWDIDGNEYIDLLNGFGPIELGHLPEFVKEAVLRQLEQGIEIGPQTQLAGEVAELLCELTGTERATFCNTGSEAVMAAMRLARTVTARSKVVLFAGDYHGNFEEVLVKKIGGAGSYKAGPIAPGIPQEMVQNMVVLDYGTPESLEYIRENASELAAILVEPIQSRHPALQPRDFLKAVREITTASGTALIFDEIVTGFRVHQGGSQAYYGIQADLATYGKVLGGGFPIGAIAGKPRFMDALDGGHWQYGDDSAPEVGVTFFAGTFVRHPLALAAAKAVLIHLKQAGPSLQENLAKRTAKLVEQLNEVFRRYSIPTQAESCGSVFYFSFTHKFRFGSLLYYNLREKGIHIQEGFPCFLTTAHTDEDLARVVSAFEASAREMAEGGLLGAVDSPSAADAQRVVAKPAIVEPPEPEEAPVTEAQLEIWLSAQLSPEANCAFNESFSLRLQGELDEQALRDSVAALVQRHQALRATFDSDGSRIHFRPKLDIALHAVDLTGAPVENRERQYREFLEQDASTPFDLVDGPLVRLALVRMDATSHILVFTAHHIVCDGWSTNVLIGELAEMYSARRFGRTPDLQPRLPFGTWAHTQREEASKATEVESYWLKRFKTLPPVLDLPIDRPRASVKTYAGSTYRYTIGGEALKHIKKSAARQGATLFNVMLAGFHSLLFRLTGQSDIVVGVPAAAQSLVQDKALVGHAVNFLALRGSLEENETFTQFLKKSKASLLDAYEHQNYTYGTLVRKLSIIRDASRLPLIEVQFNLERIAAGVQFTGLELKVEPNPKRFVNFDIFFNAVEASDSLVIDCDFNTDLFDEATMARWLEHYETLLLHVANQPGETVLGFSLLNEGQQKEVIEAQKVTQGDYPRDSRVEDLISTQAKKTPRAGAVICDNEHLDYEQLEARSNQLARYLRTQGVQNGSNVAICLDRSVDMLVAVLAVMKAGATYIPLDPMLPKERLELILTDAGVSVALSQSHVLETVGGICPQAIAVDMVQQEIASVDSAPLPTGGSVEDPAYIIYTSGSTGKPKGVAVSHRAVVNFLWSMLREPGIKSDDRLLAVTTLSFDIAGLELYLPLICGACVVIANQTTTHDGELLRKELLRSRISVMQATPATWRMLLDAGWEPNPSLKMLCGGEALPRPLANELTRNNDELWNMYGPTETTIWSAVSRVVSGDAPVRIGKPIANTQFYVLDTNQQLVPLGVPGELVIGGDGLAKGYYQRPELTAEKFISNHISPDLGDRLYRTGDLVKAHSDGTLEFLGRLDHQIKIRGFRVELGEIEAVLGRYANIRDVVVVDRENAGVKHLVTYYTTYDGQAVNAADFKTFLFDKLPPYMAPSFFVLLEALPRTPNGKVDRRSLPAFDLNAAREKKPYRAPRSNQERELAAICAEVLQLDKIGVDDNLLELGADSIQIFRIVARANKIGIGLTAQQVLRSPNIESMAQSSSMAGPVKDKSRLSPIMPVWRTPYRVSDQKFTGTQTNGRQ